MTWAVAEIAALLIPYASVSRRLQHQRRGVRDQRRRPVGRTSRHEQLPSRGAVRAVEMMADEQTACAERR
jgi:hypothetical protein